MRLQRLFPHLAGLVVESVAGDDHALVLTVRAARRTAACPLCGRRSARVHGRYRRTLADRPCAGRRVTIHLRVRRFACRAPTCPRAIFAERFPALAAVRARRTHGQRVELTELGFALGGRPAARLARRLHLPASRSTLLRLVRAAPEPAVAAPRALGVDEWSYRRGRRFGTLLIDLETRRPVDLLPERSADALAAWLAAREPPTVICRDRGGAYADGARRGAPDAAQVADRFHLSRNAGEALERVLARHHRALRAAAEAVDAQPAAAPIPTPTEEPVVLPAPTRAQRDRAQRRERRLARYEVVVELRRQAVGLREIARQLGMGRQTVRRFVRAGGFPERAERRRTPTHLTPFEPHLRERWAAGCRNARQLWEELGALGFRGSEASVRRFVAPWRTEPAQRGRGARRPRPPTAAPASPTRALSPRQATWLLLRRDEDLKPDVAAYRAHLLEQHPAIAAARRLLIEFRRLVRERDHAGFAPWLAEARASDVPEVRGFATGLLRDRQAVEAALATAWSNGATEGHVNRLKLIKRSMYGRANADLLRIRVLRAA